jgi:membrane dipeptidase
MRVSLAKIFIVLAVTVTASLYARQPQQENALRSKAQKLAQQFIIVDTHIDAPYRLRMKWEDISQRTKDGEFDFVRAKQGGLNAPFMSIYIPAEYEKKGGAKALADTLIDMVEKFARDWPTQCAVARSAADVTKQFKRGVISLCMGMENGSPIEHDMANVQYFFDRGIRYITLAHARDNHISDSSYDTTHVWRGLSFFGRRLITEMNRVGIMVDVSHISDAAFYEVMNVTKAPVIASHSSCRFFTPGFERNMSDEMITILARQGGVIQINFGSSFLSKELQQPQIRRLRGPIIHRTIPQRSPHHLCRCLRCGESHRPCRETGRSRSRGSGIRFRWSRRFIAHGVEGRISISQHHL